MFNPAPSKRFEYETGFFFGRPPGPTGTAVEGGAMTSASESVEDD
jgi:hypothetical protein